jgi:L-gulonate 5-dehydrogenase|tara:strand:- start:509 stop:1504 length:996 start_codon:yes stop_codon:yes gene_type:complete
MKALVNTSVETLEYLDYVDPIAKTGEELVRIQYSGICGSDMHAFLGHDTRRPTPNILGHEASGTIIGGLRDGTLVTINPLSGCGTCSACLVGKPNICVDRQIISMPPRAGAFADMVAIPSDNLLVVPSQGFLKSAALTEPLACGWHAARLGLRLQDAAASDLTCVVLGGGAIGVGAALCLGAMGVKNITVIEVNSLRLETLHNIIGFQASDGKDVHAPKVGTADLVIDGVGYAATRASACELAKPGGVISHIGLGSGEGGVDVRRMTLQEITFIGCYTYTPQDFRDTGAAIFSGQLGSLDWVETRPLSEGKEAFDDIRNGRAPAPKIILIP